jgi:hypothetical protein
MSALRPHDVFIVPPQLWHHVAINSIHTYAGALYYQRCPSLEPQAEQAYARVIQSVECSVLPHNSRQRIVLASWVQSTIR